MDLSGPIGCKGGEEENLRMVSALCFGLLGEWTWEFLAGEADLGIAWWFWGLCIRIDLQALHSAWQPAE